jgi:hypothetical protein
MLAVRVRRQLSDRAALPRNARRAWSNTEKGVLRRARSSGLYSNGRLTESGAALLARVDDAKAAMHRALAAKSPISRAELRVQLGSEFSEWVAEAAIFDLELDKAIAVELMTCPKCTESQLGLRVIDHDRRLDTEGKGRGTEASDLAEP